MLVVGVAHPEAAAEVVDVERAERRDAARPPRASWSTLSSCEPTWVCTPSRRSTGLRSMRAIASTGVVGQQAELRAGVARRLRGVGGGLDAGDDPHQARLRRPRGTMRSSRSMSSKLSTTTRPTPCSTASSSSSSVLALPCRTSLRRVGARLERGEDLAAAGDVEVQTLLDHDPLNGRARERLRRERDVGTRPAAAERGEVVAGPLTQGVLGDDDGRGAELGRPRRRGGSRRPRGCRRRRAGSWREEAEQLVGDRVGVDRHTLSVPLGRRSGCAFGGLLLCL